MSMPPSVASRVFLDRLHVPREAIPEQIGDMVITEDLLRSYAGHEFLLKARAKHPEHCRPAWDELRMCIIERYDRDTCEKISEAYRPCSKELERAAAAKVLEADDARRRALSAKSKELEQREAFSAANR